MSSRVGHVSLRVVLPHDLAPRKDALARAITDDLVIAVLDELEARVHARFGPRAIVRIRALPITWRLELDELADATLIARLADDLASALIDEAESLPRRERLRPRDGRIAVLEDEEHADAAFLADEAEGRGDAWVHTPRTSGNTVWRDAVARGAASVLAVIRWLERMERLDAALARQPAGLIATIAAAIPHHDQPIAVRAATARDEDVVPRATPSHAPEAPPSPVSASAPGAAPHSPLAEPAQRSDARDLHGLGPLPSIGTLAGTRTTPPTSSAVEPAPAGARDRAIVEATVSSLTEVNTEHAGLFYLIGRVLELDLAEHLWAAGLPEGDVLAHVATAIVGTDADPAPHWFGGVFDGAPARPDVPTWARDEVNERVMHSLGRRLVRCGVDTTPARLDTSLDALANAHRPAAPLERSLASIVQRSAAALTALVAARLGVDASAALTRGVCARPGRLILDADHLVVSIPSAYVEIDYRRAGLDHDPGRAPWLRRRVTFAFPGADEL
jgi:hypothetical protein